MWATVWQLGGAGVALLAAGGIAGEPGRLDLGAAGLDTAGAFAFLVVVGSVLAHPARVVRADRPSVRIADAR
jgi:hypothetical protein